MKFLSAIVLAVSLFVALTVVSAVTVLSSMDGTEYDIHMEDLTAGRLGPMFMGPTLWANYPLFTPTRLMYTTVVGNFANPYSFVLVNGLFFATVYLMRWKGRMPWALVSVVTLGLGIIPYVQGRIVLHDGTAPPEVCGPWVATMLLGVLYASVLAAVVASMELTGWHTKLRAWTIQHDGES